MLSIFFALCSVVGFSNVWKLYKDKMVCGVSLFPSVIYASTNAFEVAYFAYRHEWLTAGGAVLMCSGTTTWLVMALHYRRQSR